MTTSDKILILTPIKDAAKYAERFALSLKQLTYPKNLISVGFIESDSRDNTFDVFSQLVLDLNRSFCRVQLWKKDFSFFLPPGTHRHENNVQVERRATLAKARNHLLSRALEDEDWVLWLDVDVVEYPTDIIETMLKKGKSILHPHCVQKYGGRTYDLNAWKDQGRLHMQELRSAGELIRLDSVGGTMLFIKADVHRDGLIFPPFPYGIGNQKIRTDNYWYGEIETEGLGIMADDMGIECWGMPRLEIKHA